MGGEIVSGTELQSSNGGIPCPSVELLNLSNGHELENPLTLDKAPTNSLVKSKDLVSKTFLIVV